MSKSGRWEDESSTQGMGYIQDALGIPNTPPISNGEMSRKLQQQLIDATKDVSSKISTLDMRVVATDPNTQTEVLERVGDKMREGFASALNRQMEEYSYREWERENDRMARESQAEELTRAHNEQIQEQAAKIGEGIGKVVKGIGNVSYGIAIGNSHLSKIENRTSSIDMGVARVANTLDTVTRGQALQTEYLEQIQDTINSCSRDTNSLLEDLTDLAIENIQQQAAQHEATNKNIKKAFERAIGTMLIAMEVMKDKMLERLDLVNEHLVELTEIGQNIAVAIEENTEAITGAIEENTEAITGAMQENTEAITGAIGASTEAITGAIEENTETMQDLAYRSEGIRAMQYQNNGSTLFKAGLYKEALAKLLEAHSYLADFETSILLAQTYIKLKQTTKAFGALNGALKLAQCSEEKGRSKAVYAQLLKITEKEGAAKMATEALLDYPPVLHNELNGFWENEDELFAMLKDLRAQNIDNPNALGLCLAEFSKRGSTDLTSAVLEDLDRASASGKAIPILNQDILDNAFPDLLPSLKEYLKQKKWELSPDMCFWLSKILLERNEIHPDARILIIEGIKHDAVIKNFLRKRDYKGIVQYLQLKLGNEVHKLKSFFEVPSSIRNLL